MVGRFAVTTVCKLWSSLILTNQICGDECWFVDCISGAWAACLFKWATRKLRVILLLYSAARASEWGKIAFATGRFGVLEIERAEAPELPISTSPRNESNLTSFTRTFAECNNSATCGLRVAHLNRQAAHAPEIQSTNQHSSSQIWFVRIGEDLWIL